MQEPENIATAVAEPEPNTHRNKWRMGKAVAGAALALAAGGEKAEAAIDTPASLLAPQALIEPGPQAQIPELPVNLRRVENLPGYGSKITPEIRKQLSDSTVKIIRRHKEYPYWMEWCTATKVKIGREVFLTSAKHCFKQEGWERLRLPSLTNTPAVNLAPISEFEYAVADPGPKKKGYPTEISPAIAKITGIMVDPNNPNDLALLKPDISDINKGPSVFNDIPALDIMKLSKEPVPGEEVALYGLPANTNHKPVAGKGIYLGSSTMSFAHGAKIAFVGIKAKDQTHDSCLFGASGSSGKTKDTVFSGLAFRNNTYYYGKDSTRHPLDNSEESAAYWRTEIEKATGVEARDFTTVCMFTVDKPQHWLKLRLGMNNVVTIPPIDYGPTPPHEGDPQKGGNDQESENK